MAKQITGEKPRSMKKTICTFLRYLGNHKFALLLMGALVIASAGANLYGTHLLSPLIDNYILPHDYDGPVRAVLFMGLIYVGGVLCIAVYKQLMTHTAQSTVKKIREDLFSKMQKLPPHSFDTNIHRDVMSHFTNDLDMVQDALNNCFDNLIQSFVMITGTLLTILLLNWKLSLTVMLFMVIVYLMTQYLNKKSKYHFSHQQVAIEKLNGLIEGMVGGVKVAKVFNHERKNYEESERRNKRLCRASTEALTYSGRTIPVVVSISYFSYAIVACIDGFFAIGGETGLGALASYLAYVRQTALSINQFTQQLNFILAATAGAERIFEMMEECEEVDEGYVTLTRIQKLETGRLQECQEYTGHWTWRHPYKDGSVELAELRGDVRFHDVVFGCGPGVIILKGVNLYAKPGQKIVFVGSTGAGKATITNLTNRSYNIENGNITHDDIDIKLIYKDDLRRPISIVLQGTYLFTGTIAGNIRYGNLYVDMNDVINAAKLVNAHSLIKRLPNGYDMMLSGDGADLSQGQRQLLAIARAAIVNPPVLILDKATSSIDTRTEKLIEKGMDRLMENRTVFVIAHRLSTVCNFNVTMVPNHGEITERGSHDGLLEDKGRYCQLYTGQFELD